METERLTKRVKQWMTYASSIDNNINGILLDKNNLQHLIIRNLNPSEVDRLRAVCKNFRIHISKDEPPPIRELSFPCPTIKEFWQSDFIPGRFFLTNSIVYSVLPLNSKPTFASLLRIEETFTVGVKRVLHPLNPSKCITYPKTLNLLDNDVKEIYKIYRLEFRPRRGAKQKLTYEQAKSVTVVKVLATVNKNQNTVLMALTESEQVGVWKYDTGWTTVLQGDALALNTYHDIAECQGRLWLVKSDKLVSVNIETLESSVVIPVTPNPDDIPFFASGQAVFVMQKGCYLVEVMGRLYRICSFSGDFRDAKVDRLTEKPDGSGSDWESVEPVDFSEAVVFVGRSCSFSVRSTDFVICRPNSLYLHVPFAALRFAPPPPLPSRPSRSSSSAFLSVPPRRPPDQAQAQAQAQPEEYSPGSDVVLFSNFDYPFQDWERKVYGLSREGFNLVKDLHRYAKIFWGEHGSRKPLPKKLYRPAPPALPLPSALLPSASLRSAPLVESLEPFLCLLGEHMFSNDLHSISIMNIDSAVNSISNSQLSFSKGEVGKLLTEAMKVSNSIITLVGPELYMIGL